MMNLAIVLIAMFFALKMAIPTLKGLYDYTLTDKYSELNEACEFIQNNTNKDDIVLSFLNDLSLNRRMERDRFVVYKFIPAEMNKIPEWYERELFKRKLQSDFNLIKDSPYNIDFLLSNNRMESPYLEQQYKNSRYYLYKIKPGLE